MGTRAAAGTWVRVKRVEGRSDTRRARRWGGDAFACFDKDRERSEQGVDQCPPVAALLSPLALRPYF